MNYRKFYVLAAIPLFFLMALAVACSDNKEDGPLRIPDMWEEYLTLDFPNQYVSYSQIEGGIPPYTVSCESDLLKVSILEQDNIYLFQYEALDVGKATVIIGDAAGNILTIPIVIEYSDFGFKIESREVNVVGGNLTAAQHEELIEKALDTVLAGDGGFYRFVYNSKQSGILYVHKTAPDATRYEGTFKQIETGQDYKSGGFECVLDGQIHTLYWDLYSGPGPRVELAPRYAFYEDLTKHFLPDYPELKSLIVIQVVSR